MVDSEKLCGLVSGLGRGCEMRKLRVNMGRNKAMSLISKPKRRRIGNGVCLMYLGSPVAKGEAW